MQYVELNIFLFDAILSDDKAKFDFILGKLGPHKPGYSWLPAHADSNETDLFLADDPLYFAYVYCKNVYFVGKLIDYGAVKFLHEILINRVYTYEKCFIEAVNKLFPINVNYFNAYNDKYVRTVYGILNQGILDLAGSGNWSVVKHYILNAPQKKIPDNVYYELKAIAKAQSNQGMLDIVRQQQDRRSREKIRIKLSEEIQAGVAAIRSEMEAKMGQLSHEVADLKRQNEQLLDRQQYVNNARQFVARNRGTFFAGSMVLIVAGAALAASTILREVDKDPGLGM